MVNKALTRGWSAQALLGCGMGRMAKGDSTQPARLVSRPQGWISPAPGQPGTDFGAEGAWPGKVVALQAEAMRSNWLRMVARRWRSPPLTSPEAQPE